MRSFAERYFAGQDPIGKHLHFPEGESMGRRDDEIVGVVGHIKQFGLDNGQWAKPARATVRTFPADTG